jgi:3-phenylpropionate/cinnamic acid dioxygenase small subunit
MVERRKPGSPLRPTKPPPRRSGARARQPAGTRDARAEIAELVYAYAERIDAGDFAGLAALLGHAVVKAGGAVLADRDAAVLQRIYETTTRRYEDGTPRTRHVVTNLIIEIDEADGAAASARSTFTVYQALADFPLQAVIAGRYHDRFRNENGIWRFDEREIVTELFGDLSRHLLITVPR